MAGHSVNAGNLFATPGGLKAGEVFEPLLEGQGFLLERIVSLGHVTEPGHWYDQPRDEWVVLLTGEARLEFDGESQPPHTLVPGTYVHIKAHQRHRVAWTHPTKPTIWLALHFDSPPPR